MILLLSCSNFPFFMGTLSLYSLHVSFIPGDAFGVDRIA